MSNTGKLNLNQLRNETSKSRPDWKIIVQICVKRKGYT